MLSLWEKNEYLQYDYIIIGAGIVGLSVAAEIIEQKPQSKIAILERGIFPTGASTKNAGFACFGSLTEIISDEILMGTDAVLNLTERRFKGLQLLKSRLGENTIDFVQTGGYELLPDKYEKVLNTIPLWNKRLQDIFGYTPFVLENDKITTFNFNPKKVKYLLKHKGEGQINTGKMMKALTKYVMQKGVEIFFGTEVRKVEQLSNKATVHLNNTTILSCNKLGICTNAYASELIHEIDVLPFRGIVLYTENIANLPFNGLFHLEEGYYYFRNVGQRVILGGGRHLDFISEQTDSQEINTNIFSALQNVLYETIFPTTKPKIEGVWAGTMAFGKETKLPIVNKHSNNIYLAVRMGGMGVAVGSLVAKELVNIMNNN